MKEPGVAEAKMEERLIWAKGMIERLTKKKFEDMPMELQIKSIEVGISLFIQSERNYSKRE